MPFENPKVSSFRDVVVMIAIGYLIGRFKRKVNEKDQSFFSDEEVQTNSSIVGCIFISQTGVE